MTTESLPLLIMDEQGSLFGSAINDWDMATIVACMSEDISHWCEVPLVWPRYKESVSSESCEALGLQRCDHEKVITRFENDEPWVAIDMSNKRLFSGGGYDRVAHSIDWGYDKNEGKVRIPVRLPPWWQVCNNATVEQLQEPRETPLEIPNAHRDILWGDEWITAIAKLMLAVVSTSKWREAYAADNDRELYDLTKAVHRDWLMTGRSDLGGRRPRESLHGGRAWIESLILSRHLNMTLERQQIPLSSDLQTFRNGPMGIAEVCTYFDANRHLIASGWTWIANRRQELDTSECLDELAQALTEEKRVWLDSPLEGGSPPAVAVRCERQRVPQMATAGTDHIVDDGCPVCLMTGTDNFGSGFLMYDGHHLELDDEFAFSLCEHRSDWEEQQAEYEYVAQQMESDIQVKKNNQTEAPDSVWKTSYVNWELASDSGTETLAIGFLLAEIVATMQDKSTSRSEIQSLNTAFLKYRSKVPRNPKKAAREFKRSLQLVALRHKDLVSRSADLQSKLDELNRR